MRKLVFGHLRAAKAQISLRIRINEGICCSHTELSDTAKCLKRERLCARAG